MGFYRRVIFPRLCDWALDQPLVDRYRKELLAEAGGQILEIGFGTGLNLPHYPAGVRRITTVEPNAGMDRRARRRAEETGIEVDQRQLCGESLPFDDGTFDRVVCTFTLCSVADPGRVLGEAYRVLKPGGRFLFLEHGLSPEPGVCRWQRRLNRLQMLLADGCHLDRNVRELVAAVSFRSAEVKEFYADKMPRTHGYLYRGAATR
jgi:ubiquinone/menaquinone biosynthesis C-methylase UbiE